MDRVLARDTSRHMRKVKSKFRRWTPVISIKDLRDVPAGTKGKVLMPVGFTWIRYHVLFDNGVEVSSLDETSIALDESGKKTGHGIRTPWAVSPTPRPAPTEEPQPEPGTELAIPAETATDS